MIPMILKLQTTTILHWSLFCNVQLHSDRMLENDSRMMRE
jgi:hypothetical protein